MITIEKIDSDLTEQCTSCHCSTQEKQLYMMHIFKDPRQTIGIKLCDDCLKLCKGIIENLNSQNAGMPIKTPCDIDETLYLLHKASYSYADRYEIIKVFCAGVYNYGKGWYAELRTNRNKYKYIEYRVAFTDFGIRVFKTKEEAEERIKLIYS